MATAKGWKANFGLLAESPLTYVVGFAVLGAALSVAGVAVLSGVGWALVTAGAFLLAAAAFITRGMSNG